MATRTLMFAIAVICTIGCTKPDDPNNGGNGGGGNGQTCTISVSASPISGGIVSGNGIYQQGQSCTVIASAATDYIFTNWTEGDNVVSSDSSYTFPVIGNRSLVANFTRPTYTIDVFANPANGGSVSEGGNYYHYGQTCMVTATAASDYTFANWMVNDSLVSTNPLYSFVVTGNCTLVANFVYIGSGNNLTGAIDGKFTINANGDQVYFSQGNLQYFCSITSPQWRFAEHQYDYVTFDGDAYSENSNKWIDLFGWGTSGWDNGNICYRPWDTWYDEMGGISYGPHDGGYSLTGIYANADWGVYNMISNGGNQAGLWRTLSMDEWAYVFNSRSTTSGILYAKACVNDINGVILLPDDWNISYCDLSSTNTNNSSFNSNVITASQWVILEQHGAVFLPAAGIRSGTLSGNVGSHGCYWSSSFSDYNNSDARAVCLWDLYLSPLGNYGRSTGLSVRLVHDVD